jgi:hypothetical protein
MRKLLMFLVILLAGCEKSAEEVYTVKIERFDEQLMNVQSKEELEKLLSDNPGITDLMFNKMPSDTAFIADVFHMVKNEDAQKLHGEVQSTFGDLSKLSQEFGSAFNEIKKLYPDFKAPRIIAGFTGLQNDMVVTDSMVVVSLDAFIGPKALYRPHQPDYILRRFAPEYIVPNTVRFLSNKFNKMNFEKDNFTTDMVFFGKSLEFCRAVLPSTPDSVIIGYTNREMQNAFEHQDYIWAHVLDRELLNNDNPAVNTKYFGERPYLAEISPDCPARIGQWLGLRVVELYRENNKKVSLQELMANDNAEDILRGSKYRGQKN